MASRVNVILIEEDDGFWIGDDFKRDFIIHKWKINGDVRQGDVVEIELDSDQEIMRASPLATRWVTTLVHNETVYVEFQSFLEVPSSVIQCDLMKQSTIQPAINICIEPSVLESREFEHLGNYVCRCRRTTLIEEEKFRKNIEKAKRSSINFRWVVVNISDLGTASKDRSRPQKSIIQNEGAQKQRRSRSASVKICAESELKTDDIIHSIPTKQGPKDRKKSRSRSSSRSSVCSEIDSYEVYYDELAAKDVPKTYEKVKLVVLHINEEQKEGRWSFKKKICAWGSAKFYQIETKQEIVVNDAVEISYNSENSKHCNLRKLDRFRFPYFVYCSYSVFDVELKLTKTGSTNVYYHHLFGEVRDTSNKGHGCQQGVFRIKYRSKELNQWEIKEKSEKNVEWGQQAHSGSHKEAITSRNQGPITVASERKPLIDQPSKVIDKANSSATDPTMTASERRDRPSVHSINGSGQRSRSRSQSRGPSTRRTRDESPLRISNRQPLPNGRTNGNPVNLQTHQAPSTPKPAMSLEDSSIALFFEFAADERIARLINNKFPDQWKRLSNYWKMRSSANY